MSDFKECKNCLRYDGNCKLSTQDIECGDTCYNYCPIVKIADFHIGRKLVHFEGDCISNVTIIGLNVKDVDGEFDETSDIIDFMESIHIKVKNHNVHMTYVAKTLSLFRNVDEFKIWMKNKHSRQIKTMACEQEKQLSEELDKMLGRLQ